MDENKPHFMFNKQHISSIRNKLGVRNYFQYNSTISISHVKEIIQKF